MFSSFGIEERCAVIDISFPDAIGLGDVDKFGFTLSNPVGGDGEIRIN